MQAQALRQLELLLSPFGILTFTTGAGEVGDFLKARYGPGDIEAAFRSKLAMIANAQVVILGIPNDNGAGFDRGSKKGPLGIRQQFLKQGSYSQWEERGVVDIGDVRDHPLLTEDRFLQDWVISDVRQARWGDEGEALQLPVSAHSILERVYECLLAINPKIKVLLLGGDHSNSQIPVNVFAKRMDDFGILQLDAHTDLLETRDGLPASYATWAWHANQDIGGQQRLVQVGVRTSGTERSVWEERLDLNQIWADEINAQAVDVAVDQVIAHLERAGVKRLYLSNDIDGLSPEYAAATGTPEPNGLTPEFEFALINEVGKRFDLVSSDIMEVAPTLSRNIPEEPARTLEIAAALAKAQIESMLSKVP